MYPFPGSNQLYCDWECQKVFELYLCTKVKKPENIRFETIEIYDICDLFRQYLKQINKKT